MKYTTEDYKRFLSKEISAQIKEYESVKNTKAVTLKDNGAIFVGKFIKFDESGIAIFMVRNSNHMPRRRTYWTAVYLVNEMSNFNNWGHNSWGALRANYQREFSDAYSWQFTSIIHYSLHSWQDCEGMMEIYGNGEYGDAVPIPLQGISSLDPSSLRGAL